MEKFQNISTNMIQGILYVQCNKHNFGKAIVINNIVSDPELKIEEYAALEKLQHVFISLTKFKQE